MSGRAVRSIWGVEDRSQANLLRNCEQTSHEASKRRLREVSQVYSDIQGRLCAHGIQRLTRYMRRSRENCECGMCFIIVEGEFKKYYLQIISGEYSMC